MSINIGNGLTGMRQRLENIGGRLHFDSEPQAGFAVNAWMPVREVLS